MFALTHDEATQNSNVIAGTLFISIIPVYMLIDIYVTHSFISNLCLANINASCQKNDSVLEFSKPSGRTIDTYRIRNEVQINFDELTLEADFYVIKITDFELF